tara:strand:- start:2466 stop:2663 length:198 start_codon:yes stop_codon:yes gene_type:complete
MIKKRKTPANIAGVMGQGSFQPGSRMSNMTIDPLERLQQKAAGRSHGKILDGIKPEKRSILTRRY